MTANGTERQRQGPSRALVGAVLGVVVLAVLGLFVLTARGDGDDPQVSDEVRAVTVTGETLATFPGSDDPAAGSEAPAVSGEGFDGRPLTVEPDGRPKVIVFLAHWCPHCRDEVPVLAAWLDENGAPDDLDLYAVASRTDPELPNHPPSEWLEREGFDVPTIADDADASALMSFGASAFPFFVALDADHRVVARTSGELSVAEWEALLEAARSGTPPP
jgi:cytochrome c biogenesis protein CcmG/thiol:disulfide interchange protein DsbE